MIWQAISTDHDITIVNYRHLLHDYRVYCLNLSVKIHIQYHTRPVHQKQREVCDRCRSWCRPRILAVVENAKYTIQHAIARIIIYFVPEETANSVNTSRSWTPIKEPWTVRDIFKRQLPQLMVNAAYPGSGGRHLVAGHFIGTGNGNQWPGRSTRGLGYHTGMWFVGHLELGDGIEQEGPRES